MELKTYKHIFFDLDHTLWDFEKNSKETLEEMYADFHLNTWGIKSFDDFYTNYKNINLEYWRLYRENKIQKHDLRFGRFYKTLKAFGVEEESLTNKLADRYVESCPRKQHLFPFALEILNYLKGKYKLHVITNGFKESQYTKLTSSGIRDYFEHIITSEDVQSKKPDRRIFEYSMQRCAAINSDCIMIGDNLIADILGAKSVLIDQVYFNPFKTAHKEQITFEVGCLSEIKRFL
ncbi:MAG: noncanonical pyrimidine nucleotidase, YjjG family [Chitinophagaceae bacterium]|nr:MAG: noncanonical pyrimidine nucleotidase, YjjG family [Chitinophagaceae bacterium]